jgi:hypothetical protein
MLLVKFMDQADDLTIRRQSLRVISRIAAADTNLQ